MTSTDGRNGGPGEMPPEGSGDRAEPEDPDDLEDDPVIRVKGADGEWRVLKPAPRVPTDDPEYEALWALRLGELEAILEDPSHPQYEKAKAVSDEVMAPLRDGVKKMLESSAGSFTRALSPFTDRLRENIKFVEPLPSTPEWSGWETPDLSGIVPAPDPGWEVLEEQRETNKRLGDLVDTMAQMLDVAKADADAARNDSADAAQHSQEQTKLSRHALGWAIGATIIAFVIGVVTIWVTLAAGAPDQDQQVPIPASTTSVPSSPSSAPSRPSPTPGISRQAAPSQSPAAG
ncbi:hypothetical protein ACTHAM_002045 [Cellulomonas soli]|uniref:hypothetical protein n=1 Tax=Cellulomonas soli TaxID=931535 RepID=UPI003F85AFF7